MPVVAQSCWKSESIEGWALFSNLKHRTVSLSAT